MRYSSQSAADRDFRKLVALIRATWKIEFPANKRVMLETRLAKRARVLGLGTLGAYYEYLHTEEGMRKEGGMLVDAVTTHKTDFFREPGHFDYLARTAVPELIRRWEAGVRRPLMVWSAASSTGEEPYTIAMVLAEVARVLAPKPFRFQVEATDISTVVLETAATAVYTESAVAPVPEPLRRQYVMRSKDRERALVRIVPALRSLVTFRQLNLLDAGYGFAEPLDIVFCRNVMIYFDRATQETVLKRILATLRPGGYLIMGHSESLGGMQLPVSAVTATVYRRSDG